MVHATETTWLPGGANGRRSAGSEPHFRDYLIFLVGTPLFFALWATAIGMAPAPVLGLATGFLYIATQVMAAWWANALAAGLAGRLLPTGSRLWLRLVVGFWLAWLPLCLFYQAHAAFFASILSGVTGAMGAGAAPAVGEYLLRLLRFSLPFLPLWIVAVYGYQFIFGVRWFEPRRNRGSGQQPAPSPVAPTGPALPEAPPAAALSRPGVMSATRFGATGRPIALHAQEHYIKVWTEEGTDLVRYRFGDALDELAGEAGGQVHRSWWVCWDAVNRVRRRGRSLELDLANGLRIPVSVAHKSEVQRRFPRAAAAAPDTAT